SLIGTGEAQAEREMSRAAANPDYSMDFSPREILTNYIREYFPVTLLEEFTDEQGNTRSRPVERDGAKVVNPEAIAKREELIKSITDTLELPDAPLQALINAFGRANVAELTGRVDEPELEGGKFVRKSRAPEGVPKDKIN